MNLADLADGLVSRCTCGAWVWANTRCDHPHPYEDEPHEWVESQ